MGCGVVIVSQSSVVCSHAGACGLRIPTRQRGGCVTALRKRLYVTRVHYASDMLQNSKFYFSSLLFKRRPFRDLYKQTLP